MQNLRLKAEKEKSSLVLHCKVQNWRLRGNLPRHTFMQYLGLKVKNSMKTSSHWKQF